MATSSSATAIDLSRLPPPEVVEQVSYEAVLAEMIASLVSFDPDFTAITNSDPAMKVLQVCAYRETLLRQKFNDRARQLMVAYATGADLQHLGALVGVEKLDGESDDDLRRRIVLAPEGFSVAGPEGAYVFHALSADRAVLDASAITPAPGHVLVTVLSRDGDGSADEKLLTAVAAAVSDEDIRPLTDYVTVQSATIAEFEVVAEITTFAGPDVDVVLAEARRRLDVYVIACHMLGRDATRSGIIAALSPDGVQDVNLHSPAANVVTDRTQATWCTGITVTHVGYAD